MMLHPSSVCIYVLILLVSFLTRWTGITSMYTFRNCRGIFVYRNIFHGLNTYIDRNRANTVVTMTQDTFLSVCNCKWSSLSHARISTMDHHFFISAIYSCDIHINFLQCELWAIFYWPLNQMFSKCRCVMEGGSQSLFQNCSVST